MKNSETKKFKNSKIKQIKRNKEIQKNNSNVVKINSFAEVFKHKQIILISNILISILIVAIVLGIVFTNKRNHGTPKQPIVNAQAILSSYLNNKSIGSVKTNLINNYGNKNTNIDNNIGFNSKTMKIVFLNSYFSSSFMQKDILFISNADILQKINNTSEYSNLQFKLGLFNLWLKMLNKNKLYLFEITDIIKNKNNYIDPLATMCLYDGNKNRLYFLDFDKFNGMSITAPNSLFGQNNDLTISNHNLNSFYQDANYQLKIHNANPLFNLRIIPKFNEEKKAISVQIEGDLNSNFENNLISINNQNNYSVNNVNKLYGIISDSHKFYYLNKSNAKYAGPLKAWIDMNTYNSYFFAPKSTNSSHLKNSNGNIAINDNNANYISDWNKNAGSNYLAETKIINDNKQTVYDMSKINFDNGGEFAEKSLYNPYIYTKNMFEQVNSMSNWDPSPFVPQFINNMVEISDYLYQNAINAKNKNNSSNKLNTTLSLRVANGKVNNEYFFNSGIINWSKDSKTHKWISDKVNDSLQDKVNSENEKQKNILSNSGTYFKLKLHNELIVAPRSNLTIDSDYGMTLSLYNGDSSNYNYFTMGSIDVSLLGPLGLNFFNFNLLPSTQNWHFNSAIWSLDSNN